ncbi:hypothetical protein D3C83_233440 [compost metagenome]
MLANVMLMAMLEVAVSVAIPMAVAMAVSAIRPGRRRHAQRYRYCQSSDQSLAHCRLLFEFPLP